MNKNTSGKQKIKGGQKYHFKMFAYRCKYSLECFVEKKEVVKENKNVDMCVLSICVHSKL